MSGSQERSTSVSHAEVDAAAERLDGHIRHSPLFSIPTPPGAPRISLKLECFQISGSFKFRGALNRILLDEHQHSRAAAASGGNHGAAVAHACKSLGLGADIFVPENAPRRKLDLIRAAGGRVHVVSGPFTEAARLCADFAAEHDALLIHPFDDPAVVAGQGTVGTEILQQCPEVTAVTVAVGGGGLAAGIAVALAEKGRLLPVEPSACPTLASALSAGAPTPVPVGGVASDSLGAPILGRLAFEILAPVTQDVILVSDDAILDGQRRLWTEFRIAVEPAAGCCWAGTELALNSLERDDHLVAVICGANFDLAMLVEEKTPASRPEG